VPSDLGELQVQWLACVQFFLMLSPCVRQKIIEASHLVPIVPPGFLNLCHDIALSLWFALGKLLDVVSPSVNQEFVEEDEGLPGFLC
jgi:hypothetical protein